MKLDLNGRHALVCGASSGIGRAAALELAELGAEVTVLARRADLLASLVSELEERGASAARAIQGDLDDREDLVGQIADLLESHGPVHVLIHNSGGPPGGHV